MPLSTIYSSLLTILQPAVLTHALCCCRCPQVYLETLSELQDRLPSFPNEIAFAVVEEELGVPVSSVYSQLSEQPVAAASLGQVRVLLLLLLQQGSMQHMLRLLPHPIHSAHTDRADMLTAAHLLPTRLMLMVVVAGYDMVVPRAHRSVIQGVTFVGVPADLPARLPVNCLHVGPPSRCTRACCVVLGRWLRSRCSALPLARASLWTCCCCAA